MTKIAEITIRTNVEFEDNGVDDHKDQAMAALGEKLGIQDADSLVFIEVGRITDKTA